MHDFAWRDQTRPVGHACERTQCNLRRLTMTTPRHVGFLDPRTASKSQVAQEARNRWEPVMSIRTATSVLAIAITVFGLALAGPSSAAPGMNGGTARPALSKPVYMQ